MENVKQPVNNGFHAAFGDTPHERHYRRRPKYPSLSETLEYGYRWTNNVMGSWSIKKNSLMENQTENFNPNVTVMKPTEVIDGKEWGHRSTSVGDQMLVGNKKYVVASFGFDFGRRTSMTVKLKVEMILP